MKRVVIGLSGGVDSSVAAYLLKEQGYDVIGMFMKNWHDESVTLSDDCPWIDDSNDALLVANALNIPFQVIDLSEEYKERIVEYMFNEYASGRTPNPDILCNREIKFDVFLKHAINLGADYVATGHYCRRRENEDGSVSLLAGIDKNKDQSYFLCQLHQSQLQKILFPIGELEKSEVRKIASEQGFVTAEKKDSQGLCFVGKISLPDFLQQKLILNEGSIIEIPEDHPTLKEYSKLAITQENVESLAADFTFSPEEGLEVGRHQGAHFYTIGQRKGLHIGGRPLPSFVVATDTVQNTVYSGQGEDHPALHKWALSVDKQSIVYTNLKHSLNTGDVKEYQVRIRYRQPLQKARLIMKEDKLFVLFDKIQRGITPGQFCAWYDGDELIGSGVISD
ncbi:MAG: tRNA 2-thiouridine(34) synthase MnmA [Brumimicrobium sp.]|nr:tRNA 2-thiouridine(34) synthase MnmA [Brumimicrobium sp.]